MSSGFVSETELAERRKLRQEEWEKVRQPDQPVDMPEDQFDHRSLFDRLEEQKQRKQQEYEEAHRLKNMIKGLDDDEVDFLDLVDRKKMEAEQMKELEEKKELLEFRKKVEKLQEDKLDQRIQAEIRPTKNNHHCEGSISSQQKLLKGVVVRKRTPDNEANVNGVDSEKKRKRFETRSPQAQVKSNGLTCVGILPSLCNYPASSDESDHSSDSEPENKSKYDLVGRKITYATKSSEEQT